VSDLLDLYRSADPLVAAFVACAVLSAWCWLASVVTRDYSQVDRLWSILPVLYVFHFAARSGFAHPRLTAMTVLALLWGTRLTYNFARKGGYRAGGEDYRWPELQARLGSFRFQLFNLTFVAPFQNVLLLLLAVPTYVAAQPTARPLGDLDLVATLAFLGFWIGEAVADEQQWRFQSDKHVRRDRGERVREEFLTRGLFRYSRHPNFFCEQGMWWAFYLFAVAASGRWIDWPIAGPVILTLLFQGSTNLTEELSLRKYPAYAEYQKTTSRFLPLPPKR
jgi:steroid 5-alpha reductase family enzyme